MQRENAFLPVWFLGVLNGYFRLLVELTSNGPGTFTSCNCLNGMCNPF